MIASTCSTAAAVCEQRRERGQAGRVSWALQHLLIDRLYFVVQILLALLHLRGDSYSADALIQKVRPGSQAGRIRCAAEQILIKLTDIEFIGRHLRVGRCRWNRGHRVRDRIDLARGVADHNGDAEVLAAGARRAVPSAPTEFKTSPTPTPAPAVTGAATDRICVRTGDIKPAVRVDGDRALRSSTIAPKNGSREARGRLARSGRS